VFGLRRKDERIIKLAIHFEFTNIFLLVNFKLCSAIKDVILIYQFVKFLLTLIDWMVCLFF
jgi:hypothetical protein